MNISASYKEHEQGFTLHRLGRLAEAESHYREAVALNPGFKEAWMNLGLVAMARRQPEAALNCQRTALRLDPDLADAHNNLGMIHHNQGHLAEAENCFRSALRLSSGHASATLNLGAIRQLLDHPLEAEGLFRRAIALGVDGARARSNLALSLLEQVRPEEAEAVCNEALAIDPACHEARANRALALLTMGRLAEGWADYEIRWQVEAMGAAVPRLPQPRWTGQALRGETVLLYAEQGFGDVIQFARYVPMVAAAGGRVVLVVPRALRQVMRTLDGVDDLLTDDDQVLPADFAYHCPLMSLPLAFGTTLETIPAAVPYLRGDVRPWASFLEGLHGLKVGLVWGGLSRADQPHAVAIDKRRSMRLADLAPLLSVPGCRFVSLQLGVPAGQLADFAGRVADVSDRLMDWSDTAGLIAGLDLVISVDTAVAHLAGALGKTVWMLNRFDSCWRWLRERTDSPWYPTMRLFRQGEPGDWDAVVSAVREALVAVSGG